MNIKNMMRWIFCTIIAAIIIVAVTIIISLKVKMKQSKENEYIAYENTTNSSITKAVETLTNSEEEKVSPNAKLSMTQLYKKCGHTVTEEYNVPRAIVNMNEESIKKYYSGWKVDLFSKDYIKLSKTNEGMCKEHYVIKDTEGYINIFIKNEKDEEELYRATDIITKYLSKHDQLILKKGVEVIGKNNLERLIEDFQ